MKMEQITEIIECLPKGKTAFKYCPDRYAAFLLGEVMGEACPARVLERTAFAKLLNNRLIKPEVDRSGHGVLYKRQFIDRWTYNSKTYLLTLALWGDGKKGWSQVSRKGFSLVLQLNFNNDHDQQFRKLARPSPYHGLSSTAHPVMDRRKRSDFFRETLAWARIDLDFNTNEALIEELQTDWLRNAARLRSINNREHHCLGTHYGLAGDRASLERYFSELAWDYGSVWDEALLTATLQFIHRELGIANIYLHTPACGAALKRIRGFGGRGLPPRSIYDDLPKKFCFGKTGQAPEFLCQDAEFRRLQKKLGGTRWNYLNLGENYARITSAATAQYRRPVALAA